MKQFNISEGFKKEYKKLSKKYKTLDDDLENFKRILEINPYGIGKNFVVINSLPMVRIIKARMACRMFRNRSLRIVYSYFEKDKRIEFIEIYFKGDKKNEDRVRIRKYLQENQTQ